MKPEATTGVEQMVAMAPILLLAAWMLLSLAISPPMRRGRASSRGLGGTLPMHTLLALVGVGLCAMWILSRLGTPAFDRGEAIFSGAIVVDHLTNLLDLCVLAVTGSAIVLDGRGYQAASQAIGPPPCRGEREPLMLLAALGAMAAVHAGHLGVLFVGLELMGLALVVLTLLGSHERSSAEEVRRQLVSVILISSFTLMGIALIYAGLSTMHIESLGSRAAVALNRWGAAQPAVLVLGTDPADLPRGLLVQAQGKAVMGMAPVALFFPGTLFLLAGLLARVGIVPFPLSGRAALGSQLGLIAVVAALLRLFVGTLNAPQLTREPYGWLSVVVALGLASAIYGGVRALRARKLQRIGAFLGLANAGVLVAAMAVAGGFYGHRRGATGQISSAIELEWSQVAGDTATGAVLFGLVVHVLALTGFFAAQQGAKRATELGSWVGLGRRRPALGAALTCVLLAMAGSPPTAGFVARVVLLRSASQHSAFVAAAWVMAFALGVIALACLRVISTLYLQKDGRPEDVAVAPGSCDYPGRPRPSWPAKVVLYAAAGLTLVFGVAPDLLLSTCRLAGVGISMTTGSKARHRWVRKIRVPSGDESESERSDLKGVAQIKGNRGLAVLR